MKSKLLLLIVFVLVLLPPRLGAQDNAAQPTTQAQAAAGAQAEAQAVAETVAQAGTSAQAASQASSQVQTPQARIDLAMESAAEAGVPVSLLASKVSEGEAKGVPPERIATAVETRLAALIRASGTLDRAGIAAQSASELSVTVDALEAGVSEAALVEVSQSSPPERRVVAIAVLADLVRLGNEPGSSAARVNAALGTNASLANLSAEVSAHAALMNLQAEVASQLRLEGLGSILDELGGSAGANGGVTGGGTLDILD